MYESIKVAQFGVGSQKELELLAAMDCPEDLIIVVLTHDTDQLYLISHHGCEELVGASRTLIEGGMFPNITGNITPRFKLMRVDVPTILANAAKIAEQQSASEKKAETKEAKKEAAPKTAKKTATKTTTRKKTTSTETKKTSTTKKTTSKKPAERKETAKKTVKKPAAKKMTKKSAE